MEQQSLRAAGQPVALFAHRTANKPHPDAVKTKTLSFWLPPDVPLRIGRYLNNTTPTSPNPTLLLSSTRRLVVIPLHVINLKRITHETPHAQAPRSACNGTTHLSQTLQVPYSLSSPSLLKLPRLSLPADLVHNRFARLQFGLQRLNPRLQLGYQRHLLVQRQPGDFPAPCHSLSA